MLRVDVVNAIGFQYSKKATSEWQGLIENVKGYNDNIRDLQVHAVV